MERLNTILLVIVIGVASISLFRIFKIDSFDKQAMEKLKEAERSLEDALQNNVAVQDSVGKIRETLASFQNKNELLKVKMDSITLADRLRRPKDWDERQSILRNVEANKDKLIILRDKNGSFD